MKKAYIMPLAEVVKTETKELICQASILDRGSYDGNNAGVFEKDEFENLW